MPLFQSGRSSLLALAPPLCTTEAAPPGDLKKCNAGSGVYRSRRRRHDGPADRGGGRRDRRRPHHVPATSPPATSPCGPPSSCRRTRTSSPRPGQEEIMRSIPPAQKGLTLRDFRKMEYLSKVRSERASFLPSSNLP
jgi:hypothetical protein